MAATSKTAETAPKRKGKSKSTSKASKTQKRDGATGSKSNPQSSKTSGKNRAQDIRRAYIDHLLLNGTPPPTIYRFVTDMGIDEKEFYRHYTSFDAIEEEVWYEVMDQTMEVLESDAAYGDFTAREKFLAFLYTHLEVLKDQRSYALLRIGELGDWRGTPPVFRSYKERFVREAKEWIDQAIHEDEIASRPFLSDRYHTAFWLQLVFVLKFWASDRSPGFESSDAAIEKAVNLSFKILGDTTPDSIVDFAKFLWQSR